MILSSALLGATGAAQALAAASTRPAPLWLALPSVAALVGYLVAWSRVARPGLVGAAVPGRTGRLALVAAFVAQAIAIGVDIADVGGALETARFGFAPSLSMTHWMVLAVFLVESRSLPLPGAGRLLAMLGVIVVALAWAFPGEVRPQAETRWAPLHWALGIASYGLFGAAALHALLLGRAERRLRLARGALAPAGAGSGVGTAAGLPLLQLERLTFRFVAAGFVVLSATLLLGLGSSGPWRWDHKTVFSILAWSVFAGLLAGRRAFGWRGPVATRGVYIGAGLLLLAYAGSRFVFEVLLHRAPG